MDKEIINYLLVGVVVLGNAYYWYKQGYKERERVFQENNVTFQVSRENVMIVSKENDGTYKARILNEKLVEIIK